MIHRLEGFELDTDRFELRRAGEAVPVEPQTLLILMHLIENRDRLVTKADLVEAIWDGRAVSDWAVSAGIKSARIALGDTATPRRFVRTVHGKGFRFVGAVSGADEPARERLTPSLAVAPFENLGGDPDRAYFAEGLAEDLFTDLSKVPDLRVASRNGSLLFNEAERGLGSVAATLGVEHVLQGSVRRDGPVLRINARLVEAATGRQIWADRFDGRGSEIFAVQDAIGARIVAALKLRLAGGPKGRGTRDAEAYDLSLRGRAEYHLYTPRNLALALAYFERATEIDPDFAEAWAWQSYCRTSLHVFAWPGSDETLDAAAALARKAVALDPGSAVARARLGWVLGFLGAEAEAVGSFEAAASIAPENAEVRYAWGETLNRLGRPDDALPILETSFALERFLPPGWAFGRGHSLILGRRYDAAMEALAPVTERLPGFIPARVQRARMFAEMDRFDDATAEVAAIRAHAPRYGMLNARRMFPYPQEAERARLETGLRAAGLGQVSRPSAPNASGVD